MLPEPMRGLNIFLNETIFSKCNRRSRPFYLLTSGVAFDLRDFTFTQKLPFFKTVEISVCWIIFVFPKHLYYLCKRLCLWTSYLKAKQNMYLWKLINKENLKYRMCILKNNISDVIAESETGSWVIYVVRGISIMFSGAQCAKELLICWRKFGTYAFIKNWRYFVSIWEV